MLRTGGRMGSACSVEMESRSSKKGESEGEGSAGCSRN